MNDYEVFVRNWWKVNKSRSDRLEPDPSAKKTHYCFCNTEEEARKTCQEYNAIHPHGRLSRKAEFRRV